MITNIPIMLKSHHSIVFRFPLTAVLGIVRAANLVNGLKRGTEEGCRKLGRGRDGRQVGVVEQPVRKLDIVDVDVVFGAGVGVAHAVVGEGHPYEGPHDEVHCLPEEYQDSSHSQPYIFGVF